MKKAVMEFRVPEAEYHCTYRVLMQNGVWDPSITGDERHRILASIKPCEPSRRYSASGITLVNNGRRWGRHRG